MSSRRLGSDLDELRREAVTGSAYRARLFTFVSSEGGCGRSDAVPVMAVEPVRMAAVHALVAFGEGGCVT